MPTSDLSLSNFLQSREPCISKLKGFGILKISESRFKNVSFLDGLKVFPKNDILNLNQTKLSHSQLILVLFILLSPDTQELCFPCLNI